MLLEQVSLGTYGTTQDKAGEGGVVNGMLFYSCTRHEGSKCGTLL